MTLRCSKCQQTKLVQEFPRNCRTPERQHRNYWCRVCVSLSKKRRYAARRRADAERLNLPGAIPCAWCDTTFFPRQHNNRFCTDGCRRAYQRPVSANAPPDALKPTQPRGRLCWKVNCAARLEFGVTDGRAWEWCPLHGARRTPVRYSRGLHDQRARLEAKLIRDVASELAPVDAEKSAITLPGHVAMGNLWVSDKQHGGTPPQERET